MLARNRRALDALVGLLLEKERVGGDEIRAAVEAHADAGDLAVRAEAAGAALL